MRSVSVPRALLGAAAVTTLAACSFQGGLDVTPAGAPQAVLGSPGPGSPSPSSPSSAPSSSPSASSAPSASASSSPSSSPSPSGPSSPAGEPSAVPSSPEAAGSPATVTPCTTTQLSAALTTDPPSPGVTTLSATVVLTNLGRATCHLKGFGGVALARSDGAPVLSSQRRTDAAPQQLTLAPGDTARSSIGWSGAANPAVGEPTTGDCEPVPTSLLVIPPDQIDDLAVPWSGGPVCDQGTITQSPYTAP